MSLRSTRLGREGYTQTMHNRLSNARYLSEKLAASPQFEMINEAQMLPIVALKLKDRLPNYTVFDLASALRKGGWIVPAYTVPLTKEIAILRVVVREHFSRDMAATLYTGIYASL